MASGCGTRWVECMPVAWKGGQIMLAGRSRLLQGVGSFRCTLLLNHGMTRSGYSARAFLSTRAL